MPLVRTPCLSIVVAGRSQGLPPVEFERFCKCIGQAPAQILMRAFLAVDARDLLNPTDPLFTTVFHDRRVFHVRLLFRRHDGATVTDLQARPSDRAAAAWENRFSSHRLGRPRNASKNLFRKSACTTRSDQSCSSLPRQTSCGSRSRLRRSQATRVGLCSDRSITDRNSAVGMFFRDASSWVRVSTVLPGRFLGTRSPRGDDRQPVALLRLRAGSERNGATTISPSMRWRSCRSSL